MKRAILLFAMALAGCASESGEQTFAVPCAKLANGAFFAEHDFGTTDPAVLGRVVALLEGVTVETGVASMPGDEVAAFPDFIGSVAVVDCSQPTTETVVFVLGAQ